MSYDAHKNFAYTTVTTAPSPATSGTSVTVASGAVFPAVPFNATVWPVNALPITANAEIVRVTAVVGSVLTITRAQESSTARSIIVGDQVAATVTLKTLTDIETALDANTAAEFTQANADGLYSVLAHTHAFAALTAKPTTLAGYGIIDAATPGGATNQVQYNNAGAFAGAAGLQYFPTYKQVLVGPNADGRFTGGADYDPLLAIADDGRNRSNPTALKIYATQNTAQTGETVIGMNIAVDPNGANPSATGFNSLVQARFTPWTGTGGFKGGFMGVSFNLPTGTTNTTIQGLYVNPYKLGTGTGTAAFMTGIDVELNMGGAGSITSVYGVYVRLVQDDNGVTMQDFFGSWIDGGTALFTGTKYGSWINEITGGANNYAFWYDSPGVYRIKGDGVMAYYNPAFTKYTPGAANFERAVQQWNTNVLEYGVEVGGTGVARQLRLLGSGVLIPGTLNVTGAITGALTGNVTGNVTGSSGSTTGNAATATALLTARTINGVTFDGTANITVTAAASTLTGTVLNASVVTSSLTAVGTITSGVWTGTAIAIANGGTGQGTAANAINALLPTQTGNSGKYLTTDGTVASWATVSATDATKLPLAGGTMTGTITSTLGTIVADTPWFSGTQTWNNAAIVFTAFKLNVTNTASNSASLIFDVQLAGVTKFNVDRAGSANLPGSLSVGNIFAAADTYYLQGSVGLSLASNRFIKWSSTTSAGGSVDVGLYRNAAGVVEVNNGTAGTFRDLKLRDLIINGATNLLRTSAALTDNAGASAGTLANAPSVGNPTKWVRIDDNGTARFLPLW